MSATFVSESLAAHHNTEHFTSGKPSLDSWLKDHAAAAEAKGVSRTFVWHEHLQVVAYYSTAAHLLQRDELPDRLGRGNPNQIPAIMLARLALSKTLQGQGLGSVLLVDALHRIIDATKAVGARFVVVDAIDANAASFYTRHGFKKVPETMRLVQKVSAIQSAITL